MFSKRFQYMLQLYPDFSNSQWTGKKVQKIVDLFLGNMLLTAAFQF